jgi:hypothetical protein
VSPASRADTQAEAGAQPVGGTTQTGSQVAGAAGGTDAAAGAQMAGRPGPGGATPASQRIQGDVTGTPSGSTHGDAVTPGAGGSAAGRTGLGETASASDTRTSSPTQSATGGDPSGGNTGSQADRDAAKP